MDAEELNSRMSEISKRIITANAELSSDDKGMEDLRKREREAKIALERIANERAQREAQLAARRKALREANAEMEQLQREYQRRKHEEYQASRKAEKEALFNERIANTPWIDKAFPHQLQGAMFLANAENGLCGDDMGLGKTLQSIMVMDMLDSKRILVLAPNAVVGNFVEELQMWAPHRMLLPLMGKNKVQREMLMDMYRTHAESFVVVVGYSAWTRDPSFIDQLKSLQFDTIIADEAHKMKDDTALAFQGVRRLRYEPNKCPTCGSWDIYNYKEAGTFRSRCVKCAHTDSFFNERWLSVKHMFPMTGTPIINRPQESFPLLHLVDRSVFPTKKKFLEDYCWMSQDSGRWYWNAGGEKRLTNEIKAFFIGRKRHETGIKLPPQRPVTHEVHLTPTEYPRQYEAYQILSELQQVIADTKEDSEIMSAGPPITHLLRMRQMITCPQGIKWLHPFTKEILFQCDISESIKIDKAIEIINEVVDGGGRVVMFSQFAEAIDEVERRLNSDRVITLQGKTPEKVRTEIRHDFSGKSDGPFKWDVVLCNYKVGGLGISLVGATDAVLLDREWSPAMETQALRRIDRPGQTRETRAHYIRVVDTVDDKIDQLIHEKNALVMDFEKETNYMQILRDAYN